MLAAAEEAIAGWAPDLVLRDPTEYASAAVAHRRGVPTAQVAISLSNVEWGSIAVAAPALEELCPGLAEALSSAPYLTRFPATLDFSPFPTTMRYGEPAASPRPLPEWWAGSTAPLVYVTFGTVLGYMSIAGQVFRAAVAACARLDARVLITVGHGFDLAGLGAMPGNVHVETWVDQADVLAQAALVVCHGGSGTVLGALGAGVPLLVVPVFADQFENGRRVSATGAGVVVDSVHSDLTQGQPIAERAAADRIAAAAAALLANPDAIEASRNLAAEMAARPTIDTVLNILLDNPTAR
jgi:UDP:flavonoid glycosyltransferase YjiC (YdhE family)